MNGGRGAKGSINDRLISMMYRNRYKKLQLQRDAYRKPNKIKEKKFLRTIQGFDIDYINNMYPELDIQEREVLDKALKQNEDMPAQVDAPERRSLNIVKREASAIEHGIGGESKAEKLHELSDKFIGVDIESEAFDFEHYDYYEIISKYTGVGALETGVIDTEKEIEKVDDEIIIIGELTKFIDDSKKILSEVKGDIDYIKSKVPEAVTEEQLTELEERYLVIKRRVDELKKKYDVVKDKYDFEDFEILASINMMSAINDYKDKASLDELETLVDVCKEEIDEIDGILIQEKKSVGVGEDIDDKRKDIQEREEAFHQNKKGVIYLDDLEKRIAIEANQQKEIIKELEKRLGNFTTETRQVTNYIFHTEKMFGSFLRIAAGILSAPFTGRKVLGTVLGIHLINKGIKGLKESLTPKEVEKTELVHRYTSIEREILNSKDYVNSTNAMLAESISDLNHFDEEFKRKFKEYTSVIPEYSKIERQIDELKKRLNQKQHEMNTMSKDLERQYEANKVKVKKAS